jgi:YaiO family outer membrane protein
MRLRLTFIFLAMLILGATPTLAEYDRSAEIGWSYGSFTNDLGSAHGLFLNYTMAKPGNHALRFNVGRASRFDDTSYDVGVAYTQSLPSKTDVTAGISTGTGDFIAPDYRFDLGVARPCPGLENLVLNAGYTRLESKAENYSDGYNLGAALYYGHWLLGAGYRRDYGYPGKTISTGWNLDASWYIYRKTYLGAGVNWGEASYQLLSPGVVQVDYEVDGWFIGGSQWLNDVSGINARFDHGWTPFYEIDTITVSYFREF